MNSLDAVVARGVRVSLEKDLGYKTYERVVGEVEKMYGISMLAAVADFGKIDMVLRRLFGRHVSVLEARIFERVLTATHGTDAEAAVSIIEPTVISGLLGAYGDVAKKAILDAVVSSALSIPDIVTRLDTPKASTYIRVRQMIQDGLLRHAGYSNANDGRRVSTYRTTMTGLLFESTGDTLRVDARLPMDVAQYSYAFNSVAT